jgi:hypothetical protein
MEPEGSLPHSQEPEEWHGTVIKHLVILVFKWPFFFLKYTINIATYLIFPISMHISLHLSGWLPVWRRGACAPREASGWNRKILNYQSNKRYSVLKWVQFYDSCVIKHRIIFKKRRGIYKFCAWRSNAIALTLYWWSWYQDNNHIPYHWLIDWLIELCPWY